MRKTKIICTLGPATDNDEVLRKLVESGMDVARFNFSHGDHETHKKRLDKIKNPSIHRVDKTEEDGGKEWNQS